MILLLLIQLSLDTTYTSIVDMLSTRMPPDFEMEYIQSRKHFRIIQNLGSGQDRFGVFDVGLEFEVINKMFFNYNYRRYKNPSFDHEQHRFELIYRREESGSFPWMFSLFYSPPAGYIDESIGIGLGYWKKKANNHLLYVSAVDFSEILGLSNGDSLVSDYSCYPWRIELKGILGSEWNRGGIGAKTGLSYYLKYTIPGRKRYYLSGEYISAEEKGDREININTHYFLPYSIKVGFETGYMREDSSYFTDYTLIGKLKSESFYLIPYMGKEVSGNLGIYLRLPFYYKLLDYNSINQRKRLAGISTVVNYNIARLFSFSAEIFTIRNLENNFDDFRSGMVFVISVKPGEGPFLSIRHGLKFGGSFLNDFNQTYLIVSQYFR